MLPKLDGMLGRVCYPVPSLDPADQRFEARRYRRGPDWAMMNAPIGPGLAARGRDAQAQALRRRTAHLIVGRGFAEYFDPLSRAPAGGGPSPGRRRCGWPGSRPLRGSGETGAIRLEGGEKRLGDLQVINSVDLETGDGACVTFVGPFGCGKPTRLRRVGGPEEIGRVRLTIDGRDVTAHPPPKRGLTMMVQSCALYPRMSARENRGFTLKTAGRPRAGIDEKVGEAARILKPDDYLGRCPKALSGGQRQRVAIGRSIVRDPTALCSTSRCDPRRGAAGGKALRDRQAAPGAAANHDPRHPRPGRGAAPGRRQRGAGTGQDRAGRQPARSCPTGRDSSSSRSSSEARR